MTINIKGLNKIALFVRLYNHIQQHTLYGHPKHILNNDAAKRLLEQNMNDYMRFDIFCDLSKDEVSSVKFNQLYGNGKAVFEEIVNELNEEMKKANESAALISNTKMLYQQAAQQGQKDAQTLLGLTYSTKMQTPLATALPSAVGTRLAFSAGAGAGLGSGSGSGSGSSSSVGAGVSARIAVETKLVSEGLVSKDSALQQKAAILLKCLVELQKIWDSTNREHLSIERIACLEKDIAKTNACLKIATALCNHTLITIEDMATLLAYKQGCDYSNDDKIAESIKDVLIILMEKSLEAEILTNDDTLRNQAKGLFEGLQALIKEGQHEMQMMRRNFKFPKDHNGSRMVIIGSYPPALWVPYNEIKTTIEKTRFCACIVEKLLYCLPLSPTDREALTAYKKEIDTSKTYRRHGIVFMMEVLFTVLDKKPLDKPVKMDTTP